MVRFMGREDIVKVSKSFDYKAQRIHIMLGMLMLKVRWYEIKEVCDG